MVYLYKYNNSVWNDYIVLHPQENGDASVGSQPPTQGWVYYDYESNSLYGDNISITDKYIGVTAQWKTVDNLSKNGAIYITSYDANNIYKTVRVVSNDKSAIRSLE